VGGRRGEVGGREKFWGKEEAKKTNNFGQGGCVFGSSPKQLQRPHPQLVQWWLLVHSSLYDNRKASRVAGQVQGKNDQEPKINKNTMVSSKKKWTMMNPI
jgi:hypothetical protein